MGKGQTLCPKWCLRSGGAFNVHPYRLLRRADEGLSREGVSHEEVCTPVRAHSTLPVGPVGKQVWKDFEWLRVSLGS